MQFKRILGLALILSLSFVLTACGGGGAATPASDPTDAPDSGDTEATEDAGGDTGANADLPETASTDVEGGTLTVNYPSGWTATTATGGMSLTSSDMTSIITIAYYPETMGADAAAVMNALQTGFAAGGTASEVTEMQLGGKDAASITVTSSVTGTEMTTTYYLVTLEEGYVLVSGVADAATLEAIAGSASFSS